MVARAIRALLLAAVASTAIGAVVTQQKAQVVVHEWGTFTSVAGPDGQAVEWLPLAGPQDLPCFVERYKGRLFKFFAGTERPLTYEQARVALRGGVRMETPVLYFYSQEAATLQVRVDFPRGLMSEWYPKATVQQTDAYATVLRDGGYSTLTWANVEVRPGTSPMLLDEGRRSHYYAARQVDAAPIRVGGDNEKFLFYRGVGGFQVPITAAVTDSGVRIANVPAGNPTIPTVILFEKRGGRMGYRVHNNLTSEVTLAMPALASGSQAALDGELQRMLIGAGLYEKEARAMIETWRDSWFEDGARVFYLVPSATVNAILPLTITPTPAQVARAFVGRMDVITAATLDAVAAALTEENDEALTPYGRFLEPIAARLTADRTPAERTRLTAALETAYRGFLERVDYSCR
jgi:hypothetical protein